MIEFFYCNATLNIEIRFFDAHGEVDISQIQWEQKPSDSV